MKVVILGATGLIGPRLRFALAAMGHETVRVARTPGPGVTALDRADADGVARAADGADAVVDLFAMTLASSAPLIAALAGRVGRYVVASSGDVYRQYGAIRRSEPVEAVLKPIPEDAPLRAVAFPYRGDTPRPQADSQAWMDDYDKIPVEQAALSQAGLSAVVARLPMIWGPGDRQRRFLWAIAPMLAGARALDMDARWAAWRTTYGYVDDVAHALALCATHPAAAGVYNVGAAEAPDHAHWAERFAALMNWTGAFRSLPRDEVDPAARARYDALDLSIPLVTDTSRIRGELGYSEPTDGADALARTLADETERLAA